MSPREARAVMPATEGVVALNLQSPCRLSLSSRRRWAGAGKEVGGARVTTPFLGVLCCFRSMHANIHSSEMLKVVTGGRINDNRPLHPRYPHEDAFIQAFPPSGKSLLKRKTIRKHTQPENGKQALSYVQEKPASRGRQKQQLCHGRLVFFCHVGNAVFVC